MAGLTLTGLVIKTLTEIKAGLEEAVRDALGRSIKVFAKSAMGQVLGIMSERFAEVWEALEAVHNSHDPDKTAGAAQDAVCAITGTRRYKATKSSVTLALTGDPDTEIAASRVVSVTGTGARFETLADAEIVEVDAWEALTPYEIGDRVTNGSKVYHCTDDGASAASGGPSGTGTAITDASCVWRYLGDGTGAVDVGAEAAETGPTVAVSGSLVTIETDVSGWLGVTNLLDADVGRDVEADDDLRIRREQELVRGSKAQIDAIRNAVLHVDDVRACIVFENTTNETDADGIPPHAIEIVVLGGTDEEVAEAIYRHKGAGTATYGGEDPVIAIVTDSQGEEHEIQFRRPTQLLMRVKITLTYDADVYPEDGDDQVAQAIVDYGDAQTMGRDSASSALVAAAFKVPGVLAVLECLVGTTNPPTLEGVFDVTIRQIAVYDTSRIEVISSEDEP